MSRGGPAGAGAGRRGLRDPPREHPGRREAAPTSSPTSHARLPALLPPPYGNTASESDTSKIPRPPSLLLPPPHSPTPGRVPAAGTPGGGADSLDRVCGAGGSRCPHLLSHPEESALFCPSCRPQRAEHRRGRPLPSPGAQGTRASAGRPAIPRQVFPGKPGALPGQERTWADSASAWGFPAHRERRPGAGPVPASPRLLQASPYLPSG